MSEPIRWLLIAAGAWVAVIATGRWVIVPLLRRVLGRSAVAGGMWIANRVFCRVWHRVRCRGYEDIRSRLRAGPLIVVSNHTGAVDPLLIQSGCRFFIRWMMARDMTHVVDQLIWRSLEIIFVDRDGSDRRSLREAMRALEAGDVVGIFPEGRLVTPPEQVWPFLPGVALLIARSQAPVLLTWVHGTPDTTDTKKSILTPSRSRVEFLELLDFTGERDLDAITRTLREKIAEASGWPMIDDPPPSLVAERLTAQRVNGDDGGR